MRERYFTHENMDQVCMDIMECAYPRRVEYSLESSTLVVVDMQNWFVHPEGHAHIPSAEAVLPRIRALADAYLSRGMKVVYTKHTNTPEDSGMMGRWWGALMEPDTWATEIHRDVWVPGGQVMEKHQYDAFHGTDLESQISGDTVVIAGVMTHICCDSTARGAFMRGYLPLLCVDCTATYTLELHKSSVRALSHAVAVPVMSREIMEALDA